MSKQERRAAPSTKLLILAFAAATIVFVFVTSTTGTRGTREVQALFAQERILQATAVRNSINESAKRLIAESRILAEYSFFEYASNTRDRASAERLLRIELENYAEVAAYRYDPYDGGRPVERWDETESGAIASRLATHWGRAYAKQLPEWPNPPIVTPVSTTGAFSFVGFIHPVWRDRQLVGALVVVVDLDALLAQYVGSVADSTRATILVVDESLAVVWPARSGGSMSLRERFSEATEDSLATLERELATQSRGARFLDREDGQHRTPTPILSWTAFALGERRFAVVMASDDAPLNSLLMAQQRQRALIYIGTFAAVLFATLGMVRYRFVEAEKRMLQDHRAELEREVAERTDDVERLLARYEGLFESANDAILLVEHGRIVNCNRRAIALFGGDRAGIIGQPADLVCVPAAVAGGTVSERGAESPIECVCRSVGGSQFDAELTLNTITEGEAAITQAIVRDVTRRNRSIREKNQMLQELDHRVNNNLQIMSSLISLESRNSAGHETARALDRAHRRIYTMSVLHNRLQNQTDRDGVAADQYLTDVLSFFEQTAFEREIHVKTELDDSLLNPDLCLSLGLILGELMEDSLEHAFNGDSGCRSVKVQFHAADGAGVLHVTDNGRRRSAQDEERGLGTQIVRSLTAQLRGEIGWESDGGTAVTLRFPLAGRKS